MEGLLSGVFRCYIESDVSRRLAMALGINCEGCGCHTTARALLATRAVDVIGRHCGRDMVLELRPMARHTDGRYLEAMMAWCASRS